MSLNLLYCLSSLWKHFLLSPCTLATLDMGRDVKGVTILMMDQLSGGRNCVSCTMGVCRYCNMSLVSHSNAYLAFTYRKSSFKKLMRSRGRRLTAGWRKWENVRSGCTYYSLLGCWWSRVYLVTPDQLWAPDNGKQQKPISFSAYTKPGEQRPAQGFHFTGQEPSSDLFCDVSFRHENMNCNTIPRTILSAGPWAWGRPDTIKCYQFEPSVTASYQYWKQIQTKHFVSFWALLLCRCFASILNLCMNIKK